MNMASPLADRLRPTQLNEIVGQDHLISRGKLLYQLVKNKRPTNLILWGPAGCGKTTLARLIAKEIECDFIELSAVTAGKSDVMKVIEHAKQNRRLGMETTLFLDEIHRFNKAQQDAFLPYLEDGTIHLIGATTENPSFEIINPLLSRSRVVVLKRIDKPSMVKLLKRARSELNLTAKRLPDDSINHIAELSAGDARVALGTLEICLHLSPSSPITREMVTNVTQEKLTSYDKNGEQHYNIISAFIKSLRGSDVDASLYYLARMLKAGEDPKFIARRMVVFASEDVGIAASVALNIAVSTFLAVERVGLPECEYNLFHCALVLAKCKKSREATDLMNIAKKRVEQFPRAEVPLHARNAPTELMQNLGYGMGMKWEAGFSHPDGYLPYELRNAKNK